MAKGDENDETSSIGALLSPQQRRWVKAGAEDPYEGSHPALRNRIRKRVRQTFVDFSLLGELPESDFDKIFQNLTTEEIGGLIATLEFIYRGTRDGLRSGQKVTHGFERLLIRAIQNAEYDSADPIPSPYHVEVTFEDGHIRVHKPTQEDIDLEEVGKKIEDGKTSDLSYAELAWFLSYYRGKDDFDPQFPARMGDMAETDITSEQSNNEDDDTES